MKLIVEVGDVFLFRQHSDLSSRLYDYGIIDGAGFSRTDTSNKPPSDVSRGDPSNSTLLSVFHFHVSNIYRVSIGLYLAAG